MFFRKKSFSKLIACTIVLSMFMFMVMAPAMAATTNPSPASPGYMTLPIVFDRTVASASAPVVARFQLPFPCHVIGATFSAETIDLTSTDETYTVDIQEAGTTMLSSAVSIVAADTVYAGTFSDTEIADEAIVTIVLTVAGTTPSITDLSGMLILKRK